jgi:outer membrane protein OmpA-like peptidoglycan-associated protein
MGGKRIGWLAVLLMLVLLPSVFAPVRSRSVVPVASAAPQELSTVYFAAGITQIRPRDRSVLDAHAVWQRDEGKRVLVIEGHTDGPGGQRLQP